MATFGDILGDALRELGVLSQGETLSADDGASGLAAMNRMVDAFAADRLMIFTNTRSTCAIVPGQQNYSVGPLGDINIPWPVFPEHINYQNTAFSPSREFLLTSLTNDAWSNVAIKDLQGPLPTWFYYNSTFPLGTLQLWPVPTTGTLELVFYAPQQWDEFADLTTSISLPPGYRRMLVKNLAMELAPSYSRKTSQELQEQARESLAVVLRSNITPMDMSVEPGALCSNRWPRYSILLG